ncbi:hypothetical protein WR25_13046 isoform B [Diploscapter pachys]|nr:hypothetical protein WR25_13046 isoform B [Diploscapter pachys]
MISNAFYLEEAVEAEHTVCTQIEPPVKQQRSASEQMGTASSIESVSALQMRRKSQSIIGMKKKLGPKRSCPEYMTEYDVKMLMKKYDINRNRHDSDDQNTDLDIGYSRRSSMAGMFISTKPRRSVSFDEDVVYATHCSTQSKATLCSKGSTASDDSGMGSAEHVTEIDEPGIGIRPQATIVEEEEPKKKRKSSFSRLFRRKKSKSFDTIEADDQAGRKWRSKSVGAASRKNKPLGRDKGSSLFGSSLLNREWDIDSVNEMCRRLDLDTLEMPIPLGAEQSVILDENMIRQIMNILPPRAVGYPWLNIYNSEKHGFSLATFYRYYHNSESTLEIMNHELFRKMAEFDEDLSPVLLIIRDTRDHVFGAVVSSAIRPSEHFFGTGDSCLLWKFVNVEGDGDEAPTK